jgi:hypothetical protein
VTVQQMRYIREVSFMLPKAVQLQMDGQVRLQDMFMEAATILHDDCPVRRATDAYLARQFRVYVEHAQGVAPFCSPGMIHP